MEISNHELVGIFGGKDYLLKFTVILVRSISEILSGKDQADFSGLKSLLKAPPTGIMMPREYAARELFARFIKDAKEPTPLSEEDINQATLDPRKRREIAAILADFLCYLMDIVEFTRVVPRDLIKDIALSTGEEQAEKLLVLSKVLKELRRMIEDIG